MSFEYNGDMIIAVIYRYFCCCSSRMGLKDVFLRFKLRCSLGPLKQEMPFVEQVSFTLLELPEFGYKGIALAELFELKLIRAVINRLITENLLYPRVVNVKLSDLVRSIIARAKQPPPPPLKVGNTRLALSRAFPSLQRLSERGVEGVSFLTRMTARLLLCSCMCSNIVLRGCKSRPETTDSDDEDNKNTSRTSTAPKRKL